MANVFFKKIKDYNDKELINNTVYEMLDMIVEKESISLSNIVPLKVHFGEMGNNTFITPNNFDGIKKYLRVNNIDTKYIETNVLYKGSRTLTKDHLETAKEHGFTDLDIEIADGNEDEPYYEVDINKKIFDKCKIGTGFKKYDNFIVVAHLKGHVSAGIGGAVKQLAMGFASRGGKLHQHSHNKPIINRDICVSCGICVKKCPVNAISIIDGAAKIDEDICIGCAACIGSCPVNAISNTFDRAGFTNRVAEYAYGASLGKTNIYINYAFNITKLCDCHGGVQKPCAPDIGIFISTDPVSIDTAGLDMIQKITNSDMFEEARQTFIYGDEIGLGEIKYNLIEL